MPRPPQKLVIFGTGVRSLEVVGIIHRINKGGLKWDIVGFLDTRPERHGLMVPGVAPVLGGPEWARDCREPLSMILALDTPAEQIEVSRQIHNSSLYFPNVISPGVQINDHKFPLMGRGNIFDTSCVLSPETKIGNFNLIFNGCRLGFGARIGDANFLMPGSALAEGAHLDNSNYIGHNSVVARGVKIGQGVMLGPASAMIDTPLDATAYLGVPAQPYQRKPSSDTHPNSILKENES